MPVRRRRLARRRRRGRRRALTAESSGSVGEARGYAGADVHRPPCRRFRFEATGAARIARAAHGGAALPRPRLAHLRPFGDRARPGRPRQHCVHAPRVRLVPVVAQPRDLRRLGARVRSGLLRDGSICSRCAGHRGGRRQSLGARRRFASTGHAALSRRELAAPWVRSVGVFVPATIAIETSMFAAGVALYVTMTRPNDAVGRWSLAALVALADRHLHREHPRAAAAGRYRRGRDRPRPLAIPRRSVVVGRPSQPRLSVH